MKLVTAKPVNTQNPCLVWPDESGSIHFFPLENEYHGVAAMSALAGDEVFVSLFDDACMMRNVAVTLKKL